MGLGKYWQVWSGMGKYGQEERLGEGNVRGDDTFRTPAL